jgi:hypothetical protein
MATAYENYIQQLMGTIPMSGASAPVQYAPMRAGMENQFNVARGQLQDTLPRGGQLNSALANLITQRAQGVGGIDASLYNSAMNRAASIGSLGMGQEAQNRAQTTSNWGGLGSGLGILAGLAMAGWGGDKK